MRRTSSGGVTVPVGLLGLMSTRIFDRSVMSGAIISAVRVKFVSIPMRICTMEASAISAAWQ